jgi:hypothetical protein
MCHKKRSSPEAQNVRVAIGSDVRNGLRQIPDHLTLMDEQSVLFNKIGLPGTGTKKNAVMHDFQFQTVTRNQMKLPPHVLRQNESTGFINRNCTCHGIIITKWHCPCQEEALGTGKDNLIGVGVGIGIGID